MARKILRKKAVKILRECGPLNTIQLRDLLNEAIKGGTSASELGSMLGKDKDLFVLLRKETVISHGRRDIGTYKVCVWGLKKRDWEQRETN